jgi:hypothetical protein
MSEIIRTNETNYTAMVPGPKPNKWGKSDRKNE